MVQPNSQVVVVSDLNDQEQQRHEQKLPDSDAAESTFVCQQDVAGVSLKSAVAGCDGVLVGR